MMYIFVCNIGKAELDCKLIRKYKVQTFKLVKNLPFVYKS